MQRLKILLVFALTGTSAVFLKRFVFDWIGVTPEWPTWQQVLLWIVVVLPLYQMLLLLYGALFGEFQFFWRFTRRMFGLQASSAER